jgi:hypothetical protein
MTILRPVPNRKLNSLISYQAVVLRDTPHRQEMTVS